MSDSVIVPAYSYQSAILFALQSKPMYLGTVSDTEIARRRKANRNARKARRANR